MANRIPLIVDVLDDNKIKELPVGDNLDLGGAGVTNAGTINATDIRINNVSFNNPFSGDYNDLTNKPQIPEVPTALSAFANDVGYLSAGITTDAITEGTENLYFSNARADARIQAASLSSLANVATVLPSDDGKVVYYDHSTTSFKFTNVVTELDTLNTVLGRGNTSAFDIKTTGKVFFANKFDTEAELFAVDPSIYHGMFAHVHATGKAYFAHDTQWFALVKEGDGLTALNVAADDSTIRTVSTGESIKFVGGTGISTASDTEGNITFNVGNLGDLVDVGTAGATNGQALVFDLGASTWGPGTVASSINNIDDLGDVDTTTTTPVDDYVLSFKNSTSKWEPRALNNVDAATVTTVANATAATQFVTFVSLSDSNGQDLRTDASITYNPSTNVLGATTVTATTINTDAFNVSGSIANGVNEVQFAGNIKLASAKEVRYYDGNNTNFMAFRSPTAVTLNKTFILPDGDGTVNQVLTTDGAETLSWSTPAGTGELNEDSFKTISVAGQSDVVADTTTDTLTFVAGANMTITTSGDAITFVASGGGGGGTPGGADTQVQFNDSGSFGGDAGLIYNDATDTLTTVNIIADSISADSITSSGAGIPTITSASNLILDAANAVVIQQAPLRLGSFDTAGVAGLTGQAGDLIYNSSTSKLIFSDGTNWLETVGDDQVTIAKLNLISTVSEPSLEAKGTAGVTDGYIQLNCDQNTHGIKLKAPPHSAGASYTLTFPDDDGDADQVLKTDGTGNLDWVDQSGGGGGGWTEIESDTPTTQTLTWSSLNLAAYSVVRLEMEDVVRSANTRTELSISNDGFSSIDTWAQNGTNSFDNSGSFMADGNSTLTGGNGEYVVLTPHNIWASPLRWSGYIDFRVNGNAVVMTGQGISTDDGPCTVLWSGMCAVATFTDLKLHCFNGTFSSGTFRLLGMA